jgi:hypothetical protein
VPTDNSSMPTGWYSMPSRSDCMTQLTPKELPKCTLGYSYSTYQANRAVALLSGLWLQSYSTCRCDVGIPIIRTTRGRHLRGQQTGLYH